MTVFFGFALADGMFVGECTMDTKQCPDGSYVGRTGPSCQFAPYPGQ